MIDESKIREVMSELDKKAEEALKNAKYCDKKGWSPSACVLRAARVAYLDSAKMLEQLLTPAPVILPRSEWRCHVGTIECNCERLTDCKLNKP